MNKLFAIITITSVFQLTTGSAAVQTFTFNQNCVAQNWLIPNSPLFECAFEEVDFQGEVFALWLFTNSIQTDLNNNIVIGERYIYLGDPIGNLGMRGNKEIGDIIDATSTGFSSLHTIEQEQYEVGVPWPSNLVSSLSAYSNYMGLKLNVNGNFHYGWLHYNYGLDPFGIEIVSIEEFAIEDIPDHPIMVGSTSSLIVPTGLQQTYNPYGILLNWAPYTNSVACQVRGGLEGGTDPHNFIVQGIEPSELFINGNGLTVGQNYQWKVRCATGLNPYSGITDWSDYDYFIYDP